MEQRKLANESGHKLPIGHSPSPALRDQMDAARSADEKMAPKKAARKKAASARPLRKGDGQQVEIRQDWFAVIAGAMTLPRVSSSGGLADAASVLINAMDVLQLWRGRLVG